MFAGTVIDVAGQIRPALSLSLGSFLVARLFGQPQLILLPPAMAVVLQPKIITM